MQIVRKQISLLELPERPDRSIQLTPRSRDACASEGIDVSDLVFRPLEEFADRQLSPRLVKLRFDYFEAKRKDLLILATDARNRIVSAKKPVILSRSKSSTMTLASANSVEPHDWGMLAIEREKFARQQEGEKKWLENCLKHELSLLRKLEAEDVRLTEESHDQSKKLADESRRIKDMNDRRRDIEEQKQRVSEAQQELEKERAKKAFSEHQENLRKLQEKEALKKREAHLKSVKEAETRAQKELELKLQQDKMWEEKQQALQQIQQHDRERLRILDNCKNGTMKKLHERREAKEARVVKSIEKNRELEKQRKRELLEKLMADQNRDERLASNKQDLVEESAKKSLQLMIKRKIIQDESQRKLEERRLEMMIHQNEIEKRLSEHEQKRTRYLEFKRELEALREKNKQLNVDRQRKKEQYLRDTYAQRVIEKDSKIDAIYAERQQLWEMRRKIAMVSQKSRDYVKRTIMEMRIKSKIDTKKLESYVSSTLGQIEHGNTGRASAPVLEPCLIDDEEIDADDQSQLSGVNESIRSEDQSRSAWGSLVVADPDDRNVEALFEVSLNEESQLAPPQQTDESSVSHVSHAGHVDSAEHAPVDTFAHEPYLLVAEVAVESVHPLITVESEQQPVIGERVESAAVSEGEAIPVEREPTESRPVSAQQFIKSLGDASQQFTKSPGEFGGEPTDHVIN